MKILVVEDEPKTGNYLKQGLGEASFVVDLMRDGNDGLHAAMTRSRSRPRPPREAQTRSGWGE